MARCAGARRHLPESERRLLQDRVRARGDAADRVEAAAVREGERLEGVRLARRDRQRPAIQHAFVELEGIGDLQPPLAVRVLAVEVEPGHAVEIEFRDDRVGRGLRLEARARRAQPADHVHVDHIIDRRKFHVGIFDPFFRSQKTEFFTTEADKYKVVGLFFVV